MISFLCSEVGRGHPFYLDGLVRALTASGRADLIARRATVFEVSRGLSLLAWKSVLASYRLAGRGGAVAALYHRLRGRVDYNRGSRLLDLLGRDVRRWVGPSGMLVVDHPALAGALGGRDDVWYMHGEMVAPPESIVTKAARTFVPTEDVAGAFIRGGVHPPRVLVTGICVENELVEGALTNLEARRCRIASEAPLTLAFFSSGSEPGPHVEALCRGAEATARAGHHAIVFARAGGRLEKAARSSPAGSREIVVFRSREELDRVTAEHFPRFDAVVSPPHERSNWAVGLGVPFFLVGPDIGPFAPRNRSLLLRAGVATEVSSSDAPRLAARLAELRAQGLLLRMSEMGAGVSFRGFERAARSLAEEAERRAAPAGGFRVSRPLMDTIAELAFPRLTGTAGERRAADCMARFFGETGLDVRREKFSVCRRAMFRYRALLHAVAAAGILIMGATLSSYPLTALVLGMALLFLFATAGKWPRLIEPGFDAEPLVESENVIARRPGGAGPSLVFLAHFDSKSARFPTFVPVILILMGALVLAAITLLAAISLAGGPRADAAWLRVLTLVGAAAFLPPLWNRTGNESPGAMDNASGCAVLRELAHSLPGDPELDDVELLFVSTGAEELGLAGALRWIQAHESELVRDRTVFINLDSVGVGRGLFALDLRGRAPDGRAMADVLRSAANASGVPTRPLAFLPGVGVDTMPLSARGYATVSILGRVLGGASRRIHSARDTIEHLGEEGLRDAVRLSAALARELARGGRGYSERE